MSAIAFDIEAATAVEGLAAGAVTGGPTAPIGDTGARRVLGSPHVVAHARPRGVLVWGSLCHHVKVWTKRRGSGFKVEKTAKAVTAEARAEQGLGPKRTA